MGQMLIEAIWLRCRRLPAERRTRSWQTSPVIGPADARFRAQPHRRTDHRLMLRQGLLRAGSADRLHRPRGHAWRTCAVCRELGASPVIGTTGFSDGAESRDRAMAQPRWLS